MSLSLSEGLTPNRLAVIFLFDMSKAFDSAVRFVSPRKVKMIRGVFLLRRTSPTPPLSISLPSTWELQMLIDALLMTLLGSRAGLFVESRITGLIEFVGLLEFVELSGSTAVETSYFFKLPIGEP